MEMSDGNDTNTNTSTDDKYSTLGATNNSETETRESLCENSQDFGSHNNSLSTASEANIETLKVAHTVLFQKSEEISALGDITDAGVHRDIIESAVKETTIGGVKEDKLEGFEESIKEIKTYERGGGDASVNCLGYTEPKDPAVCTTEVTDSTKNITEKIYYSLAEVNTDGKENNAELVKTDDHREKSNKESGICMQTIEDIVVDPPENTEQVSTAINSAHDSALQCIETDKEEKIEVDSLENTEQQVNTAVNSACDNVLQFTETDKEENIEVDLPRNTEQLVSTAIDSACRILECTEAGAHIGNTYEGVGIDREESTPRVQIVQDVNTDERGTDKPKESISKDTTEVTKFLNEGNNLVTILTNSAVTESEGTITKRPETKVTETQTNCPQTDKTESEVEIISPNTFNSDIKKSGAGEGEIIKCFLKDSTNFSSPDHIPEIFITSAEPILADLPSTLETQKTKVETDSQEDDSMDVDLTQNETTLTKDVEKTLETTKYFGYNQGNPDNLSSYNDAQEPMEIAEHSILSYDNKDFDTDSDFEAEAHLSGGESKKLEAAEKEPEPEAAEKEPELEVEETQEKKMGCIKSKAKRTQYTVNQHGWSSDEENDENGWQIQQSKKSKTSRSTFRNDSWSTRDTNTYRERYPGKEDNPDLNANLKFYKGRITSCPKGDYIDEIHRKWWGNYDKLEQHHGYIQWLFPIREQGMNWHAQELQPHEAKAIMADSEAMERFLKSYKMMLHFYGMELVSEKTGEVKRAKNCQERFRHLNHSMHNYLRITRILKCLGELGLEHYKAPFICFVLKEAIVHKTLDHTLDSCFKYWIGTLRNGEERADIDKYIDELYNDRFQEEENRKSGVENFKMVEIKEGVGEEESKGKNKQEENRKRQKENSMKKEEEEGKKSQEEENRREDEETRKRQEEENRNKEKENERMDDETGKRKEEENRKRDVKNESVLDDTRKKKKDENRKGEEENERVNNETRMRQEEENTKREEKNENVLGDTRKEEENTKREEENESVLDDTRKKEEENKKREEENDETRMSQDEENNKSDEENESVLDDARKKEEEKMKMMKLE